MKATTVWVTVLALVVVMVSLLSPSDAVRRQRPDGSVILANSNKLKKERISQIGDSDMKAEEAALKRADVEDQRRASESLIKSKSEEEQKVKGDALMAQNNEQALKQRIAAQRTSEAEEKKLAEASTKSRERIVKGEKEDIQKTMARFNQQQAEAKAKRDAKEVQVKKLAAQTEAKQKAADEAYQKSNSEANQKQKQSSESRAKVSEVQMKQESRDKDEQRQKDMLAENQAKRSQEHAMKKAAQRAEESDKNLVRKMERKNKKLLKQRQEMERKQRQEKEAKRAEERANKKRLKLLWCECKDVFVKHDDQNKWHRCPQGSLVVGVFKKEKDQVFNSVKWLKCCRPCRPDTQEPVNVFNCSDSVNSCDRNSFVQGVYSPDDCTDLDCMRRVKCCNLENSRGASDCERLSRFPETLKMPGWSILDGHRFMRGISNSTSTTLTPEQCLAWAY